MEVNPQIFIIPFDKEHIIYSPLSGSILKVSPAVIRQLQLLENNEKFSFNQIVKEKLLRNGIIAKKFTEIPKKNYFQKYQPCSLTLMPTWDCNLRCKYCYSMGGDNPGDLLDIEIAKAAIDFIIENSIKKNRKKVSIGFHGGGEPFMEKNMFWIKEITNYARTKSAKKGLSSYIHSATNGVISEKNLIWITNNLDKINLSWDGTKEIQNYQRTGINGTGTYKSVLRCVDFFEKKGFPYGIRSTISSLSVNKMIDITELFIKQTSVKSFHMEPMFECGRGVDNNELKPPNIDDFVTNFTLARKLARENGRDIFYSAAKLENIGKKFCGAAGDNFFITPNGDVTSCLEVSRPNDQMKEIFIIGNFNSVTKTFDISQSNLNQLRERIVDNIKECSNCFAKYNCSGDCLAKVYKLSGSLYSSRNSYRCKLNRQLLLDELKQKIS